ncbi:MAG: hypothetical protein Q4F17_11970 [Eubacteriales bacterium]|nr:hypothetical protein [Eubacteriales bacterium]
MTHRERKLAGDAIRKSAREQGLTEENARQEIEKAIAQGMERSRQAGDRTAIEMWSSIPCEGEIPTAEEFVVWVSELVEIIRSKEKKTRDNFE